MGYVDTISRLASAISDSRGGGASPPSSHEGPSWSDNTETVEAAHLNGGAVTVNGKTITQIAQTQMGGPGGRRGGCRSRGQVANADQAAPPVGARGARKERS